MFKSRGRLFTVQPNFQGEEEEKSQKTFYWVLRDVHQTVWQRREKERGVCQLSSLSYFASVPFINSSCLLYNFFCNYSSLYLCLLVLCPPFDTLCSLSTWHSPAIRCSAAACEHRPLVWALSCLSAVYRPSKGCLCTSPPPYPSAKMLLVL